MNSMNPSFLLRLAALSLLLAAGCTITELEGGDASDGDQATVETCLSLSVQSADVLRTRSVSFTAPGVAPDEASETVGAAESNVPATKAADATTGVDEAAVKDLWIGQYDASGTLLVSKYIASFTGTEVKLKLEKATGTSHLYLVANAGDLTSTAGTELAFKALTNSPAFTNGIPNSKNCIMIGSLDKAITSDFKATIAMTRALAKISFTYTVGGTDFTFTPTALSLCNVPNELQYIAPTGQLSGATYSNWLAASPATTTYWYLPENQAGTGGNTAGTEKTKTGDGVSNATYIQLTGNATQGGITYSGVSFKLYVGNGANDYNVLRNNNYTITVTLAGVDFADKRITIGSMPPMTNPAELAAAEGATTEFNVIAQPSAPWSFTVPSWLSAKIDTGTPVAAGATMQSTGPATVTFTATKNPDASVRTADFIVAVGTPPVSTSITVTQQAGGPPPAVDGKKLYIADTYDESYERRRNSILAIPAASSFTKKNCQIEVSSIQSSLCIDYSAAQTLCTNEGTGWRLPNLYELHVMYENRVALGEPAFITIHWSTSPHRSGDHICVLVFGSGNFTYSGPSDSNYVRCVRDIP
ncbi:MAG: DUF4906 domain-containing protein [Tannerellaceae bacterium]